MIPIKVGNANANANANAITIDHPIWSASACWSDTPNQLAELYASGLSAIVGKTCTPQSYHGNSGCTFIRTADYCWNRKGLPNRGFDYYCKLGVELIGRGIPYILSLAVKDVGDDERLRDVVQCLKKYDDDIHTNQQGGLEGDGHGGALVELNIGCPNADDRIVGYHASDIRKLASAVYDADLRCIHIGLKCPPYFEKYTLKKVASAMTEVPRLAYVVSSNTIPNAFDVDMELYGGISATVVNKMIAIGNIRILRSLLPDGIHCVGCGGIASVEDIFDYLRAGASFVQLGSHFYNQMTNRLDATGISRIIQEFKNVRQ